MKKRGTPIKIKRSLFSAEGSSRSTTSDAGEGPSGTTQSHSQAIERDREATMAGRQQLSLCGASLTPGDDSPLLYLEESEELVVSSPRPPGLPTGEEQQQEEEESMPSLSYSPSSAVISTPQSSQGGSGSQPQTAAGRSSSSSHKPRGSLWEHFSCNEEDPRLATCKVCKVVVRRGSDPRHLSSSALRSHLQRHHPSLLDSPQVGRKRGAAEGRQMEAPAGKRAAAGTTEGARSSRQATLQDVLPLSGASSLSRRARARAQEATTRVVGEMVALSGVPLSFVESPGFRHLLKHLAPWYEPPSRRTLSRRVMPSLHESVREMVRGQLAQARGRLVHFTSDLWTGGHHAYLSLTAHWWQPEDVRGGVTASRPGPQGEAPSQPKGYRVVLLQARSMEDSATGRNIAEELLSALREWDLSPEGEEEKRGYMVTDAGRNMLAALNAAGLEGIVCMAHKLHLVVRDALGLGSQVRDSWCEGTKETRALLEKCRQLVGHFSRSVKAARQLREKQDEMGMAEHVLVQDMPTRWNSTLEMIARLVEQKDVLEAMMSTTPILPGGRELDISATDWLALGQMVEILRPFEETTKVLCGLEASLGHVIPLIHALEQALHSRIAEGSSSLLPRNRALVKRLQAGVRSRLTPLCGERVYQLACMCDPCIKGTLADSLANLEAWKAELSLQVRKVVEAQGGHAQPEMQGRQLEAGEGSSQGSSVSDSAASQRPSSKPSYLASAIAMAVSRAWMERPTDEQDSAAAMVEDYMAEPLQPPTADPLSYWARKSEVWPQLSQVAMGLLSIPPTSVQSERVFSVLGDILRPHRSRLDPDTVERLAFIRFNLSALGFPSPNP